MCPEAMEGAVDASLTYTGPQPGEPSREVPPFSPCLPQHGSAPSHRLLRNDPNGTLLPPKSRTRCKLPASTHLTAVSPGYAPCSAQELHSDPRSLFLFHKEDRNASHCQADTGHCQAMGPVFWEREEFELVAVHSAVHCVSVFSGRCPLCPNCLKPLPASPGCSLSIAPNRLEPSKTENGAWVHFPLCSASIAVVLKNQSDGW